MQKDIAMSMLNAARALEKEIGELDRLISQLEDGAEKKALVTALGDVIGILFRDFVYRIERQHPELAPDK